MTLNLSTIPSREIMPGLHGKLVHTENMSLVFWEVEEGATVPEHAHINEQVMHVIEGRFEFTLDGDTKEYHPGDGYYESVVLDPEGNRIEITV